MKIYIAIPNYKNLEGFLFHFRILIHQTFRFPKCLRTEVLIKHWSTLFFFGLIEVCFFHYENIDCECRRHYWTRGKKKYVIKGDITEEESERK